MEIMSVTEEMSELKDSEEVSPCLALDCDGLDRHTSVPLLHLVKQLLR